MVHHVGLAGRSVSIHCHNAHERALVEYLFGCPHADPEQPEDASFSISADAAWTRAELCRDGASVTTTDSRGAFADHLMQDVIHHLIRNNRSGYALHAAAVEYQGVGIVLPAASGAGKSTLCAWLVANGFGYLTDELTVVDARSGELHCLARPITIKAGARAALAGLVDIERHAADLLDAPRCLMVPHRLLHSSVSPGTPPLGLILFPQFRAGADYLLQPLSPAQAAFRLMGSLVNARNLDNLGLPQIGDIARQAPAFALTYSDYRQLPGVLDRFIHDQLTGRGPARPVRNAV